MATKLHTAFIGNYSADAVTDAMIESIGDRYNIAQPRAHNVWLVVYLAAGEAGEAWRKSYSPLARSDRRIAKERAAWEHSKALDKLCSSLYKTLR